MKCHLLKLAFAVSALGLLATGCASDDAASDSASLSPASSTHYSASNRSMSYMPAGGAFDALGGALFRCEPETLQVMASRSGRLHNDLAVVETDDE